MAARIALGEHAHHGVEALAREIRVGCRAADAFEEVVLTPFRAGRLGHDMLREHVERRMRHDECIELAAPRAVDERRALDQIVARIRKEPALGRCAHLVPRAAHALQECGDAARRAELADELYIADVDAELERGGGNEHAQGAALQACFGIEPMLLGHAAVMGGDGVLAQALAQVPCRPLGHAAGVDEDERRGMRGRQFGQPVVHPVPHFVGHDGFERNGRQFERQVACALVADVDDRALRMFARANEETGNGFDRFLRGRQADARQPSLAKRIEPLERQREMAAALRRGDRVDLVDDDRARGGQHAAPRVR